LQATELLFVDEENIQMGGGEFTFTDPVDVCPVAAFTPSQPNDSEQKHCLNSTRPLRRRNREEHCCSMIAMQRKKHATLSKGDDDAAFGLPRRL
jgi:hypothetical protein